MNRIFVGLVGTILGVSSALAFGPVDTQFFPSQNILTNPGFENGRQAWTASGGTFVVNSTARGLGSVGASWDSNAAAQTLVSSVAIPNGLRGRNGVAYCGIRGVTSLGTHTITVDDGTNNIVTPITVRSDLNTFVRNSVNFVFPTSGNVRIKITSVAANEPEIYLDDCYVGDAANLTQFSQAQLIGRLTYDFSASFQTTTTGTNLDFGNAPTLTTVQQFGIAELPSSSVPGVRLQNLPPGRYVFVADAFFQAVSGSCKYALFDGTNYLGGEVARVATANLPQQLLGVAEYTTAQASLTVRIRLPSTASTPDCRIPNNANETPADLQWTVYRFPLATETAYRPDQVAWRVDANLSGANPSLGTSTVASYTGIESTALTLANASGQGVIAAQVPCSGTNAPTGTTCSVGNESVGVSFTVPVAGDVLACASFTWATQTGASAGNGATAAFNIVETPANAQTILQEGKSRLTARITTPAAQNMDGSFPFRVCGTFNFASAGQRTLRLMYEQVVSGSVSFSQVQGDADAANGQRDIHWEVYPLNQAIPAPLLVGSVLSNSSGIERIERASVGTPGAPCTASPCTVASQSGSWISSVNRPSTGRYTINFAANLFSAPPMCMVLGAFGPIDTGAPGNGFPTTSSFDFTIRTVGTSTMVDSAFQIICMGPR